MPGFGLSLGIAPSSGANAGGGDFWSHADQFKLGGVDFGSDSASGGSTPITGLVRDLAVGVAVALIAKWLWGYIK